MSTNHFNQVASNQDFKENFNENQNEVDIIIENVVCAFNVRCHLDLRKIARSGTNVEYRKENHRQSYRYQVLQIVSLCSGTGHFNQNFMCDPALQLT